MRDVNHSRTCPTPKIRKIQPDFVPWIDIHARSEDKRNPGSLICTHVAKFAGVDQF